ncbi:hypothetical protein ACFVHI_10300 [Kitasatospora sp. NPDC127121]|uniref:hypothetical protein n=1 Tax=Kitasatospora sp. NPDC127121 TaxID=3345371 RepID=UPI003632CA85
MQYPLDVDHAAGEELGDGGGHDVAGLCEVVGDAVDLGTGQVVGHLAEAREVQRHVDVPLSTRCARE